jgi:hypothetical protein
LLGRAAIKSAVRRLGIAINDAIEIAKQINI